MARIAAFIYGVVAYAIFFPAFVYLFAFVGGYFVPKTVDSGTVGPLWPSILINVGLVALFGLQHAVMARPGFKRWWTQFVPQPIERSTFVLVATALIILLFWQWRPIPTVIWDIQHPVIRGVLHGLFLVGVIITLLSSFLINHFDLFGLRQVYLHLRQKPYTHDPFVLRSLYRLVRHPLMLGFLIAFWSSPTMTVGHAVFSGAFTVYVIIGIKMEERDLVKFHGEEYRRYQRETPMLIPFAKRPAQAPPSPSRG
jgi:protein-S-isoprenylcysteine O-methyltransferase Ste14